MYEHKARQLSLALVAAAMVLPQHARVDAAELNGISILPGKLAAAEDEHYSLVSDEDAATTQPATEPAATQPAAGTVWPPGLMQAGMDAVGLAKPMQDLGLRAYGYVETSFTGRIHGGPSRHQGLSNPPLYLRVFDARKFNNLILNQLKITVDRVIDTSRPFDLGFRVDNVYGADARSIHSYGLCDGHDIDANPPFADPHSPWPYNRGAHYDLEQAYAEMWIKTGEGGRGLDVIFGKWVTPLGAEVIDGPGNYLYSHSYLFGYAIPFTHTGLKLTYNFNPTNNIYFAVVRGWDVFKDNNDGASWMGGFLWSSQEQCGANPKTSLAFNFIGGPEQYSDPRFSGHTTWHANPGNRFVWDAVWTYRWTERLTQVLNGDFGFEDGVPTAIDHEGVVRKRDADWYGLAYYLNYAWNDYVNTTGRVEWFRDHYGVRTGYQGDFYEATLGACITPFPKDRFLNNLSIRPEVRWDWSANNEPFSNKRDGHDYQMTAAVDLIYKF